IGKENKKAKELILCNCYIISKITFFRYADSTIFIHLIKQ
ncbi:hypothetical protein HMPREF9996_01908, partial [Aggregatibacter actinomycetemcomitans Y4]